MATPNPAASSVADAPVRARHRHKFRRRHKPHFFTGTGALSLAVTLATADMIGVISDSVFVAELAFIALCLTLICVLGSYFLGFFMVMDGNIPLHRVKVFLPHALVGALSPLLYMLNFSLAFDTLGTRPVQMYGLALALFSGLLIAIQYFMGTRVTKVEGLRLIVPDR